MKTTLDLYTDYLISSMGQASATNLSRLLNGAVSHDSVTRFLSESELKSSDLWLMTKKLVRKYETEEGCLVFDDTIILKEYTDESDLICWHYDHTKGKTVKGVNLLSAFYTSQDLRIPITYELIKKPIVCCSVETKKEVRKSAVTKHELLREMVRITLLNQIKFKYVLADSWYTSTKNMTYINDKKKFFIFDVKIDRQAVLVNNSNKKPTKKDQWTRIDELNISENVPTRVWLKDLEFEVLLMKEVFRNEDGSVQGVRFLVTNDYNLSYEELSTLYQKRWSVEEYHKSLKQNTSIAKSPTRRIKTQSNHFFCSIWAYVKLEIFKLKTNLNHFQLKNRMYIQALKAAFSELTCFKEKYMSA